MDILISRNPATQEILRELPKTPTDSFVRIFENARTAQARWALLSPSQRASTLRQTLETLLDQADEIARQISDETGKPMLEALAHEILPSAEMLRFFARTAPTALADQNVHLRLMRHRRSVLNPWPLGVVVVIAPWNFPFLIPFADIAMALVAGNAVVFKPSEATPLTGLAIQDLWDRSGLPQYLLQTIIGEGDAGAALIQQKPAKIFFTGSVATGKKIMAAAAEHLIPVNLELGGKDPMIVLPDANLDFATSAALWGGFTNAGQLCASTERLLLHESIAPQFLEKLQAKIALLRPGQDLGPITYEPQKQVYEKHLEDARSQGANILTGGEFSEDRRYLKPTLITGPQVDTLLAYQEETFGPVIAVTTFRSVSDAVAKANRSEYGLAASIITRNPDLGEQIARQLEVGTVTINEVAYTAGLAETPWGGVKNSGFGRTHSELGLMEFVNLRHIHRPRSRLTVFKSLWWYPYGPYQFALFRQFLNTYRRGKFERLRAWAHVIWNFAQFVKKEKRL